MHCVKRVRIRNYSGPHFFRIFPYSDWIRRDTTYLVLFSPNAGEWGKIADQNNSEYGYFLRSDAIKFFMHLAACLLHMIFTKYATACFKRAAACQLQNFTKYAARTFKHATTCCNIRPHVSNMQLTVSNIQLYVWSINWHSNVLICYSNTVI